MIHSFTEEVSCPLCARRSSRILLPASYPAKLTREEILSAYSASSNHKLLDALVQCTHCNLVYLNPRIHRELILESYTNAVDPQFVIQNPHRIASFRRNLLYLERQYGLTPLHHPSVLDIGCAGGAFPKAAADAGFRVIGVEPSKWLSEDGRRRYGLDIRTGLLHEQQLLLESFDLVTLWDVIEHLTDPSDVLAKIHSLLKPNALLVINYPDFNSLARLLLGSRWPFLLSVHLIYFTPKTITNFLQIRGFEVLSIRPFWQTLGLGYICQRASSYFSFFGWAGKFFSAIGLSGFPFRYNMGQSLLVARKR